jgi:Putative zinc-finger
MNQMEMEFRSRACPEFEVFLEDHLAGNLTGDDAARLSAHIQFCAGCRSALEDAAASMRLLSAVEPAADPGPGFARMMMARVRTEMDRLAGEKSIWQPFLFLGWRFAATATLALAVLLTYNATLQNFWQPGLASAVRQAEPRDLFPDPGATPASRDEALLMMVESSYGTHQD